MAKTLNSRPLVWAHRGASAYAPENTMEAFRLAIDMKADGIEIDVHLSKDGHIVVIHDEKIDRTSNGQGKVTDYTLEELKNFDFGYKFYRQKRMGVRIPTLDELYELYSTTDLTINVEIKSADPAIIEPLHATAVKYGMVDKIYYSSFNHEQLMRMKRVYADAKVAPLYGFNMPYAWEYAKTLGVFAMHPHFDQLSLYDEYVDKCHEYGVRVNPWTIDDPEVAKALAEKGVDAFITNVPDVIKSALGIE